MIKDEEDWHGLQTTKLKSLAKLFKPFYRDWAPLRKFYFFMEDMEEFDINLCRVYAKLYRGVEWFL